MADINVKDVAEKLPTMDQWKRNGNSAVTYTFMIIFVFYFFYSEFLKKDQCAEQLDTFGQVIIQKDKMIEQLNERVSRLEVALDIKNGVLRKVEDAVVPGPQQMGGAK